MSLGVRKSVQMIRQLNSKIKKMKSKKFELIICPSFVALEEVNSIFKKTKIEIGGQDVFWHEKGAFTGEVSADMLKEVGCRYVLIGHSERREHLNESDMMINKKIKLSLKENLIPVLCIGESLKDKIYGSTKRVILEQLKKGLSGVKLGGRKKLIIAYEPVWAIGSGKTVSAKQAREVYEYIRESLKKFFPVKVSAEIRILYGGSVNGKNVNNYVGRDKLDGVLVGGASLNAAEMHKIINKVVSK